MLQARLLGQCEISIDGRPIPFHSRPAQSLFVYFLIHPDTFLRREMLAGQFWPGSSETNARNNLRHVVWGIRSLIGAEAQKRLESDDLGITYHPQSGDQLDVEQFESCQAGRASVDELIHALAVYQGDLLPGFYDEWVFLERERLKASFENKIGKLLEDLLAQKRWEEILEWGEYWIALGGAPEPAYRALMLAQAGLGNLTAAASVYQRCVDALDRELGVEPSELTQKAYAELRKESAALPDGTNEWKTADHLQVPAFLNEPEKQTPVFVCRQAELDVLDNFLKKALDGKLQVVFVSGEAGSGKTFLLYEFLRRSLSAYPEIVTGIGTCNAFFGQGVPYLPFRDILNMLAGGIEPLYVNGNITRDQALHLVEVFPLVFQTIMQKSPGLINSFFSAATLSERTAAFLPGEQHLKQRIDKLAVQAGNLVDEQEKPQLFEQYVELLGNVARQRPLLLILDDLQWMDSGTGRLLYHIFRRLQNSRILIVGAFRQEEVFVEKNGEKHPLELLLHEFQSVRGKITVDLETNREKSGRKFIDAILDSEPNRLDETFRRDLFQHTQGHPLFTVQMLRNLQERREILPDNHGRWVVAAEIDWESLPPQIEGVIGERIARLTPDLQNLLMIASVEGEQFTLQVLERIRGKTGILQQLSRELEKRHKLVEEVGAINLTGRNLIRFRFTHTLLQQYLYRQLGKAEQAELHKEVAESLEAICKDDVSVMADSLAHHYKEAGIPKKAAEYLVLAGDQARSLYAHQEAIDLYKQANLLFNKMRENDLVARTLIKQYLVYHNSFDYANAQKILDEYNSLTRKSLSRMKNVSTIPDKNTYRLAVLRKPVLDPGLADSLFDLELIKEIFCGLVEGSEDRTVIPWVSSQWEVLDNGRRYVFHLRKDFFWSDGTPVTADDFEFAWKRALNPQLHAMSANLLYVIEGARDYHQGRTENPSALGITASDHFTLEVKLEKPCGYFLYILGDPIAYAVPKHVVLKNGNAWVEPGSYITNGAFKFEQNLKRSDEVAHFVRNPYFSHPSKGNIGDVAIFQYENEMEMYQAFTLGKLDLVEFLIPHIEENELNHYRQSGQLFTSSVPFVDALYFMTDRPPFSNPQVRRAFAMAIDRERLAREVENQMPAFGGYIPPCLPGHSSQIAIPYDPESARRLLAEAGFPQGKGLPSIGLLMGLVGLKKGDALVYESLKDMWEANLGITIRKCWNKADMQDFDNRDDFNIFFLGWLADYPDPASYLESNYLIEKCKWNNPVYEHLIEEGHCLLDQKSRIECYRQADRVLIDDAVVLPLFYGHIYELRQPWVERLSGSSIYSPQWKDILLKPH